MTFPGSRPTSSSKPRSVTGDVGSELSARAIKTLEAYAWPGIDGALAEPQETTRAKSNESAPVAVQAVIPEIEWRRRERENVRIALQLAKERISGPDGAADLLGVKPTTLISRLKALGLREPPKRPRRRKNRV